MAENMVKLANGTILDGFIIVDSTAAGISLVSADPNILNCVIKANAGYGIKCDASAPLIDNCLIEESSSDGIHCVNGSSPTIEHCVIRDNDDGVNCIGGTLTITNSWVDDNEGDGIVFDGASSAAKIRNNTIVHNLGTGVRKTTGNTPIITNCILWGNTPQLRDCAATYSCIQDPNQASGTGNITDDPCFVNGDPNWGNYHLTVNSLCIDVGDKTDVDVVDPCETDIDGQDRIFNDEVDMGADEYTCDDVTNEADFTWDGIVNLRDFYVLSEAWLSDPCDSPTDANTPNWNENCDLCPDDANAIDLCDT